METTFSSLKEFENSIFQMKESYKKVSTICKDTSVKFKSAFAKEKPSKLAQIDPMNMFKSHLQLLTSHLSTLFNDLGASLHIEYITLKEREVAIYKQRKQLQKQYKSKEQSLKVANEQYNVALKEIQRSNKQESQISKLPDQETLINMIPENQLTQFQASLQFQKQKQIMERNMDNITRVRNEMEFSNKDISKAIATELTDTLSVLTEEFKSLFGSTAACLAQLSTKLSNSIVAQIDQQNSNALIYYNHIILSKFKENSMLLTTSAHPRMMKRQNSDNCLASNKNNQTNAQNIFFNEQNRRMNSSQQQQQQHEQQQFKESGNRSRSISAFSYPLQNSEEIENAYQEKKLATGENNSEENNSRNQNQMRTSKKSNVSNRMHTDSAPTPTRAIQQSESLNRQSKCISQQFGRLVESQISSDPSMMGQLFQSTCLTPMSQQALANNQFAKYPYQQHHPNTQTNHFVKDDAVQIILRTGQPTESGWQQQQQLHHHHHNRVPPRPTNERQTTGKNQTIVASSKQQQDMSMQQSFQAHLFEKELKQKQQQQEMNMNNSSCRLSNITERNSVQTPSSHSQYQYQNQRYMQPDFMIESNHSQISHTNMIDRFYTHSQSAYEYPAEQLAPDSRTGAAINNQHQHQATFKNGANRKFL